MLYRRFGRTELKMPVFSCGGMRYQHKWQDIPLEQIPADHQANLEATIARSLDLGINHIETARGYGSSERQLGQVLPKFPRDQLVVQTKIPPTPDSATFARHFRESLERLQLDYVDLLGIHGINNHRLLWYTVRDGGCLAAARELQKQGLARHVGFSTHGPTEVIQDAVRWDGDGGFDYVNLHWFYIYQCNWPAIEDAADRDMGVFIISPSDKGGMLYRPPEKMVQLCQPLHPLVFNCLYCLSHPRVHTLSIGASRPSDFDLQLTTLDVLDRAEELLSPIDQRLRQAMVDAVGADLADRHAEGISHWEETPGHINIANVLWLRNLALGWGLTDYAKMRYNLLGNGGTWFPGLHAGYLDDFDISDSIAKSPFPEQIPEWLRQAHEMLAAPPKKRLSQN
ncbi:MAG: aldo/keto reductase [Planctomycetota bacterium]